MILINFKTYSEASGENALWLSEKLIKVAGERQTELVLCPQAVDLRQIALIYPGHIWAQHADFQIRGRATGWLPLEIIKEAKATGVILNHSEHKLEKEILEKTCQKAKELDLKILIFADSLEEALEIADLNPDWIGYEPPELVASQDSSVAKSKPEIIEKVVKAVPNIPILVGAGIKDSLDVRVSLQRGAKAIGVSSAVVLAESPASKLIELIDGFK